MKDVQCYELFEGIALKNHAFSFLQHAMKFDENHSVQIQLNLGQDLRPTLMFSMS